MEFWAIYKKIVLTLHKNVDLTYMLVATIAVTLLSVIVAYVYTKQKLKQSALQREAENQRMSESQEKDTEWIEDVNNSSALKDPVEYCGHLQGKFKETKQRLAARQIEGEMTQDQKERERQVQKEQLEAIFKLMQDQNEKFGVDTMDDMTEQMRLYASATA